MTLPDTNVSDITAHPIDALALVNWMLGIWADDPDAGIIILTTPEDGQPLNNRIRVSLSIARRQLKMRGLPLSREFGINTEYFPWTGEDGKRRVAVLFRQFVSRKHRLKAAMANSEHFQAFLKGKNHD